MPLPPGIKKVYLGGSKPSTDQISKQPPRNPWQPTLATLL